MDRKTELLQIFNGADKKVLTIVEPMIEDLVFVESQLEELRSKPFIRYHPKDPSQQKPTVAYKVYRDLLAQEKDMVRILCSQLHKGPTDEKQSPLRAYLERLEQ